MIKEKFISWNVAKYPENKVWNPFIPVNDKRLEPIPLNEEWLLNFGFKENGLIYTIEIDEYTIKMLFYDCWRFTLESRFEEAQLTGFWSVHEWQNLFFALTGKELEFNSEPSKV